MTNREDDQDKIRQLLKSQPTLQPPESFYQGVWRRIEDKPARGFWAHWNFPAKAFASACVVMLVIWVSKETRRDFGRKESIIVDQAAPVEVSLESRFAPKAKKAAHLEEQPTRNVPQSLPAAKEEARKDEGVSFNYQVADRLASPPPQLAKRRISEQARAQDIPFQLEDRGERQKSGFGYIGGASAPAAMLKSVASNGESGETTTDWRGFNSGIKEPQNIVVQNKSDWQSLWHQHTGSRPYAGPLNSPPIDFNLYTVIGIFAGQKNTGGYSVEIVDIRIQPDGVEVLYHEYSPPPGSMVTQALTAPYHIKAIPKNTSLIRFKKI